MKILWIPSTCPVPVDSGGKLALFNRIKYIGERHEVYLIAQSNKLLEKDHLVLKKICKKYSLIPLRSIRKTDYIKWMLSGKSVNVERRKNKEVTNEIRNYLRNNNFDVICIDVPMAGIVLEPLWDIISNTKVIINQHNIEFANVYSKVKNQDVSLLMKLYALIESRRLYQWEKKFYKKPQIAGHIFVTKEDEALFRKSFNEVEKQNLLYCQPAISMIREKVNNILSELRNKKNIVFIAAFDYPPNIDGAVWFVENVYPYIRKNSNEVRLLLVGRNPNSKILKLQNDSITVTGTVPDVSPYFELADIFINPIFYGGGVKIKLIQAGFYGKPVVSTSFGCYGSVYEHEKEILVTDNPKQFAKYCIDILENPSKYIQITKNFEEATENNYSYESTGKKYEKSLLNLIGQK